MTTQVFARETHLTLTKKADVFQMGSLCPGAKTQLTAAPFIVYVEAMTVTTKNRFCDLARQRENLTLIPFQRTGPISPHRTPPPDTAVLQHQTISGSALLDILRSIEDDEENDVRAPKVIHVLVFGQKLGGSRIPDTIPWLEDAIDLVASSCDIEAHDVHLNMRLDIAFTFQNPEPHDIILFENTGTPYGKKVSVPPHRREPRDGTEVYQHVQCQERGRHLGGRWRVETDFEPPETVPIEHCSSPNGTVHSSRARHHTHDRWCHPAPARYAT